jgi:hypothetical protein
MILKIKYYIIIKRNYLKFHLVYYKYINKLTDCKYLSILTSLQFIIILY